MAITTAMCTSFKGELLSATHDLMPLAETALNWPYMP